MSDEKKAWRRGEFWFEFSKAFFDFLKVAATIGAVVVAWCTLSNDNLKNFFNAENSKLEKEKAVLEYDKRKLDDDVQSLEGTKVALTAENERLKKELQGTQAEWDAIQKIHEARGLNWNLNFLIIGDDSSCDKSLLSWDFEQKGFVLVFAESLAEDKKPKLNAKMLEVADSFRDMKKTKAMEFKNCLLNGHFLSCVSENDSVVSTEFRNCGIDGEKLSRFSSMPNLERLSFADNPLSNVTNLRHQPKLKVLDLSGTNLLDEDVKILPELFPILQTLSLDGCQLTDKSCESFLLINNLKFLYVRNTSIGISGLERLRDSGKKMMVTISESQATIEEMERLKEKAKKGFVVIRPGFDWPYHVDDLEWKFAHGFDPAEDRLSTYWKRSRLRKTALKTNWPHVASASRSE